ncbi:DUF1385 domain-containing protein [Brevibacillus centrosporus]|uniref:DUF1385 domain-containing protein n=1 Tax=Brevibacillus centrosporus TaxID=54910 RepID=A0A1I3TUE8_9BACL|nr:DUF1385 domain-containing protein [Brevibacillus centrosporus]MEC2132485.1 DUF1385 domain-containing protein [Brevibacillus centrosporus]MED4908584.1 DUF1385 domain-containing protein [Brevibacillus centrosporus]RNB69762.1 DUF1385 domain-containing protein [Brevibacillus centrosporus]SFJ73959.1 Protein of unknown function [Brevibacillus centrosporus]GED29687.1 hypothetical protein BCE02nite_08280 [Brevibacillus centrosporus]
MIMGMSFSRGVLFHDRNVLACAEVKDGVIHLWAEKITIRTIGKLWLRIFFSFPWYYQLFHFLLAAYVVAAFLYPSLEIVDPMWVAVYIGGFHFVFPSVMKKFHGAEHKVFSHYGKKSMGALEEVAQANIVNAGCSTNLVVWFFVGFLLTVLLLPLEWSVAAGIATLLAGMFGERYLRKYCGFAYKLSEFFQKHLTTKEPDRIHLETALRSYILFEHIREKEWQAA